MCDPYLIPVAVGMVMNYKAETDRAKEQEEQTVGWLSKGDEAREEGQKKIDKLVQDQLPEYSAESTQERINQQAGQVEGDINNAILQSNLSFDQDKGTVDNTSDAYERTQAKLTAENESDAVALAKRYAAITAPNLVNLRDAAERESTGMDIRGAIDTINNRVNTASRAAQLVNVKANPWLKIGGQALMMYGGANLGSGGSQTVSSGTTSGSASAAPSFNWTSGAYQPASQSSISSGFFMP